MRTGGLSAGGESCRSRALSRHSLRRERTRSGGERRQPCWGWPRNIRGSVDFRFVKVLQSRETKAAASSVSEGSRRVDAVCRLSLVHAAHGVTEAACGVSDRGDRPRRRCVNEQPLPGDEIGRDGTTRIDASLGSVDVNKAKGYVMDLGPEGAQWA